KDILQEEHYYPFGLSMAPLSFQQGTPNRYRYNGKELHTELGWYDYGARMYEPSIARWNGVDFKAEQYRRYSPYAYTLDNPIVFIDPDGMEVDIHTMLFNAWNATPEGGSASFSVPDNINSEGEGNGKRASEEEIEEDCCPDWLVETSRATVAAIGVDMMVPEATDLVPYKWGSYLIIGGTASIILWASGDDRIDITRDKIKEDHENYVTLYRGVGIDNPDMHKEAMRGIATPLGITGGHSDPNRHNLGDNRSIFTSWTKIKTVANKFASKAGPGGVIMSKKFKLSQIVPSPDKFDEGEILVPGIVNGANVEIVK
ncbi:MAG: RHS repeat-associated core domain-containing protein, partial [Bacteroidota bacterium]